MLSTLADIKQPDSARFLPVASLPKVTDEFKGLLEAVDDNDEPSCSQAEALKKQDLYVNTALAVYGAELLWQLLTDGMIANRGLFLDIKKFKMTALKSLKEVCMNIIDLDGKEIEVTDLALALMQADDYRHYRINDPTPMQLHLYDYWEDLYQKLLILEKEN